MYSLVRLITYQNSLKTNTRCAMAYQRHIEIDQNRTARNYCNKKEDIIDKLDNLEQKIQAIVRKKTIDCLETKCKQPDTSLPDCNVCEPTVDHGRRHPVQPIPKVCCPPKPTESGPCIRPYVNPCPPHPLKECSPCSMPVDPCREPCKQPKYKMPKDKKIMELDIRMMRVLFALTTLLAAYILYRLYGDQGDNGQVVVKGGKKRRTQKPREPQKDPQYSVELPSSVPYLIVGGGTAGYAAMKKLIELDPNAKILIISKEHYYPYNRTPLNTELLLSEPSIAKELNYSPRGSTLNSKDKKSIYYEKEEFYRRVIEFEKAMSEPGHTVSVARGWEVLKIDCINKTVHLEGKQIKYDKCIVATGSSPKNLRVFTENSDDVKKRVSTFTTVYDYQLLDEIIDSYKGDITIAIVGGGLNGTELACALQKKGVRVIQIMEDNNNMARLLPGYLAQWLTKRVVNTGVTVLPRSEILDALIWKGGEHDGNIALYVNSKPSKKNYLVFADHVLVSIGNYPNTALAEPSGFELDEENGGFVVNTELQIGRDIYAAGDCISYYDCVYGRRHFEYYEHATETGKTAAENVMSKGKTYDYQTLIWSDLMEDLGYEAVGTIDSSLPTVGIFYNGDKSETIKENPETQADCTDEKNRLVLEEFDKGIVFYMNNKETIVGILTWNVYDRAPMLRKILEKCRTYKDCDDLAKLMHIHS